MGIAGIWAHREAEDGMPTWSMSMLTINADGDPVMRRLRSASFEGAIRNAISIGGDSDTVAAIAGGVAEALFGIPEDIADQAWRRLPHDMREMLTHLYREAGQNVG